MLSTQLVEKHARLFLLAFAFYCMIPSSARSQSVQQGIKLAGIDSAGIGQKKYSITEIGIMTPTGINDKGQVSGSRGSGVSQVAVRWEKGLFTEYPSLGSYTVATGINNLGVMSGHYNGLSGSHAVIFKNDTTINLLPDPTNKTSQAYAINDLGHVAGSVKFCDSCNNAALWNGGDPINLGTFSRYGVYANDLNNFDLVVGDGEAPPTFNDNAFKTTGGGLINLGTLGGSSANANAVNNLGHIVGSSNDALNRGHAVIWNPGILSIQNPGTFGGEAYDINDSDVVVGRSGNNAFVWKDGVMKDLNTICDTAGGWVLQRAVTINNLGQIVGTGLHNGQQRAFLLDPLPHYPVFLIPGIAASYPANINDIGPWMFERGIHPNGLQIDPLAHAYDDMIKTLKNVGYVEGKDLFVVNYDWRVPPAPSDGVFDGFVEGITATSITDLTFKYSVDYLGYYLKQAVNVWEIDHPGIPLEKVNFIAHSTGGLVARAYIQSAAYRGTFDGTKKLPAVDKLIMIGVPNRGASKPWNTFHDNWGVDPSFQLVLSKIVNMGYQKVLAGAIISGPDYNITLASLTEGTCQNQQKICFINKFNPLARSLLATYNFIDSGNGFTNINGNPLLRNNVVLDLNAGLDLVLNGDPNSFSDSSKVTVMFATNVETPTSVVKKVGTVGGENAIVQFSDYALRDANPGEVWYKDIIIASSGDGTVPLESSRDQFVGDSRVTLKPYTKGTNTSEDVTHLGLMYNSDVQKNVLGILGEPFTNSDISTGLHESWASLMSTGVNIAANIIGGNILGAILDPVDGFIIDGQGRRLGYSAATGPLTEIPGSIWLGNADGLGWVMEPLVGPLSLKLSGLGGNYYSMVSILSETKNSGLTVAGVLAAGDSAVLSVPFIVRFVLAVSDTTMQFADIAKGDSVSRVIAIINKSISPMTVNSISVGTNVFMVDTATVHLIAAVTIGRKIKGTSAISDGESFSVLNAPVGVLPEFSLPAIVKDTLKVRVWFKPNGFGSFTDTLSIVTDGGSKKIPLSGNSPYPKIVLSLSSLDFGNVKKDTSSKKTIVVKNSSINKLRIDSLKTKSSQFTVENFTSPIFLTKKDSAVFIVTFKADTIKKYNDTLSIFSNQQTPILYAALTGNGTLTSVLFSDDLMPKQYELNQNYPNPFNPSTTLRYGLPNNSTVSLKIYNVLGQQVASLVQGEQSAGWQRVTWNANVSTGLYFYRLEAVDVANPHNRFVQVKKMMLIK